jgi:hypothetical protein
MPCKPCKGSRHPLRQKSSRLRPLRYNSGGVSHENHANGRGTGHDEPMLMVLNFGKGRIFHPTLGHDPAAMSCVGFITTLLRGTEWAATGKVTQKVPADFPGAEKASTRTF